MKKTILLTGKYSVDGYCMDKFSCISIKGMLDSKEDMVDIYHKVSIYIEYSYLKGYKNRIIDFQQSQIKVNTSFLIQLTAISMQLYKKFPDARSAIVSDNVDTFKEIEVYNQIHPCQNKRRIFTDVKEATKWISENN